MWDDSWPREVSHVGNSDPGVGLYDKTQQLDVIIT
jgi:hypothetical protein